MAEHKKESSARELDSNVEDLYRKDLIAAVRRLPDGDAYKAKIMSTVNIKEASVATTRAGAQKTSRENFRR